MPTPLSPTANMGSDSNSLTLPFPPEKNLAWVSNEVVDEAKRSGGFGTVLDASALGPDRSIRSLLNSVPSGFEVVYSKGLLENTQYIRDFFKKSGYLVSLGGMIVVDLFAGTDPYKVGQPYRPLSFVMYEFSVSIGDGFRFVGKERIGSTFRLRYQKVRPSLPVEDSIDSWSFGIVSDGKKPDAIVQLVDQIKMQRIPHCEVLICGPSMPESLAESARLISDEGLTSDPRPPTPAKKNRIIHAARYNNLVLMHDRMIIPGGWYDGMKEYGNYFEILVVPVYETGKIGKRILDWMSFESTPLDFKRDRVVMLPYDEWSPQVYVDGGFLVGKKSILEKVLFDERLHWGEMEDLHFSRELYQHGALFSLNPRAFVFTKSDRHPHGRTESRLRYRVRRMGFFLDRSLKRILFAVRCAGAYRRHLRSNAFSIEP
jgi:hypothetical protein